MAFPVLRSTLSESVGQPLSNPNCERSLTIAHATGIILEDDLS